ncbi:MAG: type II secretion system secretin GspD [Armatimonadota bacterium]
MRYNKIVVLMVLICFIIPILPSFGQNSLDKEKLKSPIEIEKHASDALRTGTIMLNFEDVDVKVLAKLISEITGKNIIVDDKVGGKITIVSSREVNPYEAWNIFASALETKGFSVVDKGSYVKIMPSGTSKIERMKLAGEKYISSENLVVAVVILKNADAAQLKNSLVSLISPSGTISSYDPANSIIVADIPSNIKRLTSIIKDLDVPSKQVDLKIYQLKNVLAESVEQSINKTIGTLSNRKDPNPVKIAAHPPTNSLIVYGSKYEILQVEKILKDLDAANPQLERKFRLHYLENGNAEEIAKILTTMLAERKKVETAEQKGTPSEFASIQVSADKSTNSLILYSTEFEFEALKDLIVKLDAPRKQVLVTAVVAEVSLKKLLDVGVRWQAMHDKGAAAYQGGMSQEALYGMLASGNFIMGAVGQGTTSVTTAAGATITYPNIFFLLSLLETDSDFNILSAPRLVTLDHLEAFMTVGSVQPYASGVKFDSNQNPIITYDYKDIGLTLKVTPHISQGKKIRMDINQKLQEITDYLRPAVGQVSYVVPITSQREYKTTITVEDNQTVIVGGLVSKRTIDTINKLPLLGDLPFIGKAFQNKQTQDQKITLFAFITPHIIETKEQLQEYTEKYEKYLQKQLKLQEQRMVRPDDILPRDDFELPKDEEAIITPKEELEKKNKQE